MVNVINIDGKCYYIYGNLAYMMENTINVTIYSIYDGNIAIENDHRNSGFTHE